MTKRLEGKVAIITGAAAGIGKGIALLFAEEGAKLILADIQKQQGEALEKEIISNGGNAKFILTDVTLEDDLTSLVTETLELHGDIDILCNNAGKSVPFRLEDMDVDKHFDAIFDLNIRSYFLLTQKVLPYMLKKQKGSVVNTASLAGIEGLDQYSSYCATKGAVIQFTKACTVEFAERGLRFNAIVPGLTNTELIPEGCDFEKLVLPAIPMKRAAKPREIAHAALFLASDDASYCNGTCLVVDGGKSSI